MAEYQADKLIIEIDAEVNDAKKKISSLKKELETFGNNFTLPDLTNSLNIINKIRDTFRNVGKIKFDNLEMLSKLNFDNLEKARVNANKLKKILQKPFVDNEIEQSESKTSPIDENAYKQSLSILDIMKVKWAGVKGEIKQAGGFGNILKESFAKSAMYGEGLSTKIGGLLKSIKRISFYRVIRAVIKLIGQAIKQGINNLYSFSDSFGGSFSKAMDEIKSSITYVINAFGTIAQPIIEALQPIITFLLDAVATLANGIGALLQGITGSSGITQATKEVVKFKNATTSLGIDELNTAQQSNGFFSIFGGDGKEESTISKLFSKITKYLQPILDLISKIGITVGELLSNLISLLDPLLDLVDIILTPIMELINLIGEALKNSLVPAITYVKDILGGLKNYFKTIFGSFGQIVKDFVGIFKDAFSLVSAIFSFNAEKIQQAWETLWKSIKNFFISMINGIITGFEAFINLFVDIINSVTQAISSIWTWTGLPAIPKIPHAQIPRIPYYTTGGIVEDGLFMANHNELIGGFSNGKTAVANNEQITTGIYNAVKDALQESGFGGTNETQQQINVYLDSKEIAKQVNKVNKENGMVIYRGATSYAK